MYESKVSSEHDFHGGITFFTFIILVGGGRASRHAARYIISRSTLLSGVHQEQLIRKTALISKFNRTGVAGRLPHSHVGALLSSRDGFVEAEARPLA